MGKMKLKIIKNDEILNKGTFNMNSEKEKRECFKKIIDLYGQGYKMPEPIHTQIQGNVFTPNMVRSYNQADWNGAIRSLVQYYIANDNNQNITLIPVARGGNKKQYIKLQSGGKRLVKYGKRGGRYYMKGGKKHYIK